MNIIRGVDDEVRERLYEVFEGGSLDDFEDWFVAHTWDGHQRTRLVTQVDHLLAERSLLGPQELRRELRSLVGTIEYSEREPRYAMVSTANTWRKSVQLGRNQTIRRHLELAGTSPEAGPE